MKKNLLTLLDLTREDFLRLFARAAELKARKKRGITENLMKGKTLGLIFDKPSTRTRVSFETAMVQLGGTPLFISSRDTQISRDEPIMDTARVLSRYLDGLVIRTFSQNLLQEYAAFASIPVINALTDLYHPTQVLCDLFTILEYKGDLNPLKIVWVGDGNNVSHSWINAASVLDLHLVLACPQGYAPRQEILAAAQQKSPGRITLTSDPQAAVAGADVIYTDVWASMGQESEHLLRKQHFTAFQVNPALVSLAAADAIVMHCLPAHRNEEITEDVLEGPQSVVWDQSENKMHVNKAIIDLLVGQN